MPTTAFPRMTGKRLMRRFSISRTTSSSGVSSVTVSAPAVMISWTLRPWVRVYSSASRPGPTKYSSQRGRRRCVPVSARRRKSPSVTIPTRRPSLSTTGNPLICRCSMMRTASKTALSGSIDTTGDVIISLTFMARLHSLRSRCSVLCSPSLIHINLQHYIRRQVRPRHRHGRHSAHWLRARSRIEKSDLSRTRGRDTGRNCHGNSATPAALASRESFD